MTILGLFGLALVIMKLAGIGAVAHWSWWWVTAPFWVGLAVALALAVGLASGTCFVAAIKSVFKRRR